MADALVNLRAELGRMKKHRARYHPAIRKILDAGEPGSRTPFPMAIQDPDEMRILLELIDLGYLDEDAFIVTESFGTIRGLSYRGKYALTTDGEKLYGEMTLARARRKNAIAAALLVAAACAAAAAAFLLR